AHGQTTSRLSSTFLARGEQALLEISVAGGEPDEIPEIEPVEHIEIQPSGRGPLTRMLPGRRLEYVFEYIIHGYEVGKHSIPSVEVMVDGTATATEPLDFQIFNPDELQFSEVEYNGRPVRYASSFRVLNDKPYENETTPAEIKLFVPEDMFIEDWGIPEFERDGLAAWRFQPSPMRSRLNLFGQPYISVAYPSTITPTRSGNISIGPAKIRLTTRETIMNPTYQQVFGEVYVQVPKLDIEAQPLPGNAPEGFENAVGSFRIASSTSQTDVQEGDPISVDLIVTGSGNLDTLRPPKLANDEGWKVYGTTPEQRGDERRQISGSVVFHQSIRPLEMKSEIPSYRLVYFDPKTSAYRTLVSEPILLNMQPATTPNPAAAAAVQSLPMPFERMTDILAVLRPAQLTLPISPSFPTWIGHVIAGIAALGLIAKAVWMRMGHRFRKNPVREAKLQALREVEKSSAAGDSEFLRAAGHFIETWAGDNPSPEIQAVLAERDAVCFRAAKPNTVLDPKRRGEILRQLRKAVLAVAVIFACAMPASSRAADTSAQALEAYESAKYDDAIKLWLEAGTYETLAADTLYNIGNACYRAGSPGQAALYYRRAILRDSGHQEARQNLRFIERKYGSITIQRPEYQYALSRYPLAAWKGVFWAGVWTCVLSLLIFPATRQAARSRMVAIVALVIGPVMISVGALGWRYFPNDAAFAPVAKQAVIVEDKVSLHTDAARTSPEVIDAPPGSLCEILGESGNWVYVGFATKTRGWVPVESIQKVIPEKAPEAPKFRKPKADGKTA
ncbi:MAG: hypothetical protein EOP87_12270, partial [Verrucomicrobiaceae bacterium]